MFISDPGLSGAVDEDGEALLWGGGRFWQLGAGEARDVPSPQLVGARNLSPPRWLGDAHLGFWCRV